MFIQIQNLLLLTSLTNAPGALVSMTLIIYIKLKLKQILICSLFYSTDLKSVVFKIYCSFFVVPHQQNEVNKKKTAEG
jgi:hypothetical protein